MVGSGNCVHADATTFDVSGFDAVWASPPCQSRSDARTQGPPKSAFAGDFVSYSLGLGTLDLRALWVENVIVMSEAPWGRFYNAAQFLSEPIQNRNRVIGGRFKEPEVYRPYLRAYPGICPCITATERDGCASDKRRASRFYGRRLTVQECAYHQGFDIPSGWSEKPRDFRGTDIQWLRQQYEAIGNGVPVYMAQAFGKVYT